MPCSVAETAETIARLPPPARLPADWEALVNAPVVPARFGMGTCPMDRTPTIVQWRSVTQDHATTKV
jgi:hypothetical protein